jgi:hypothetical protein
MSLRIRTLRLVGLGRTYGLTFTDESGVHPLSVIAGEISTGKTTILEFIDYCLGAIRHSRHLEIERHVRGALLEVEIEGQVLVIERATFATEQVVRVDRRRNRLTSTSTEPKVIGWNPLGRAQCVGWESTLVGARAAVAASPRRARRGAAAVMARRPAARHPGPCDAGGPPARERPEERAAGIVNGAAAVDFIAFADVAWGPAALIAVGSVAGAQLAARYGRRLSPPALRAVIVVVGLAAIVPLVT